jgi:hypothetical protein
MGKKLNKANIKKQLQMVGYFDGKLLPEFDKEETLEQSIKRLLKQVLPHKTSSTLTVILQKQIERSLKGDVRSTELLLDRAYGKPIQSLNVTQPAPITISHNVITIEEARVLKDGE